jgi:hypothetical protein
MRIVDPKIEHVELNNKFEMAMALSIHFVEVQVVKFKFSMQKMDTEGTYKGSTSCNETH